MKTALPLCLLLAAAVAAAADESLIKLSPEQRQSMGIVSQPLAGFEAGGERRLPAQAVVPPRNVEVLAAPLPGLVVAVQAAYGETVRKGQALARLQSAQALELQRDYLRAEGQARLAAESLKRDRALFDEGIIAGARLSTAEVAERQAAAELMAKREALRLAGAPAPAAGGLSAAVTLRAPFDGVILEAAAQAGARVEAAAPLFRIGRTSPLWLEIQATPAQAAGLAVGDRVTVPGCAESGRLTLIAPAMNPASQALLLRAELPGACLKPFQYTQAGVTPAQAASGRRVPNAALTRYQGGSWLFADTAAGFRPVAVRVLDESEKSSLVAAVAAEELAAETKIAVRGIAALKASWLGLGAGGR